MARDRFLWKSFKRPKLESQVLEIKEEINRKPPEIRVDNSIPKGLIIPTDKEEKSEKLTKKWEAKQQTSGNKKPAKKKKTKKKVTKKTAKKKKTTKKTTTKKKISKAKDEPSKN